MKTAFKMFEVTLTGAPRDWGRIHGESLRSQIRELWGRDEAPMSFPGGRDACLQRLVDESGFLAAACRWTPALVEEIEGLAEGAAVTFREAFAMQMLDERGWVFQPEPATGWASCSALGAFDEGGPTLLAQNADMGVDVAGYMTLLHLLDRRTGWEAYTITLPGVIGVYGLNNRGIGICLNAMGALMNHSPHGLSTIFVSRGILAQTTLDAAEHFVQEAPHASGENYTIGGPGRVVAYECSANNVARYEPWAGATRVWHTNHPVVNNDLLMTADAVARAPAGRRALYKTQMASSHLRFASLQVRLAHVSRPVSVEWIKETLSSHDSESFAVCQHRQPGRPVMSNACIIMELSGEPVLHLTSGPPCQSEFRTFRFRGSEPGPASGEEQDASERDHKQAE